MNARSRSKSCPKSQDLGLRVWIESVRIEGGILDGFEQTFENGLNVLIGGRGTGKSSVIELVRFCLGAQSYTDDGSTEATEHALGVLGDGRVTVTIRDGSQRTEITRTAQDETEEEYDGLAPFVFSQAEIETVGLQAQSRLRLIDGFLERKGHPKVGQSTLASRIRSITSEIRATLTEIDEIAEKVAGLSKLQHALELAKTESKTQTVVHKEIDDHRKQLANLTPQVAAARVRFETIGRAAERIEEWASDLSELLERKPAIDRWPDQAATNDELADLRKREAKAASALRAILAEYEAISVDLDKKQATASAQKVGLENRARDIRQRIEEKQKGASAVDKKISDLTQQISVLNSLADLRKQRRAERRTLTEQRGKLIEQFLQSQGERTAQRKAACTALNKQLQPSIRLTLTPSSQHREYVNTLTAALRGSGLRYTELAERIAETFSPQEVALLAEEMDTDAIANALEISEDRALRICDALRGDAGGSLLTTRVEDDLKIELMDGKDYKTIDFLSMGQRCTAILPIILRHTERLIVLDQPEDHLDNAFVVGTLIKAIVSRSDGAQTIVATHNPNIPVLGEADRVIHLDSDGSRCFARACGNIDTPKIVEAITTIMEGGKDAFKKRADFYSKNQSNVAKR